jgi:predicted XRE-type DNA-binding protein
MGVVNMKRDLSQTQVPGLKKKLLTEIKKEMKSSDISQGEIGRRLDMPRNNVNMVMRGKTVSTLDQLIRIANSIGLYVDLETTKKK